MHDPRPFFLSEFELADSRVEFSKKPIVLLCGGPIPHKAHPDDDDPPISSFRHAIHQSFTPYEVFCPEEIQAWNIDGIFKNLMDFESDLASICSLVVIILESPGALAELGAFSQLPDLSKKLIVINSSDYRGRNSFINLGILRFIADDHPAGVKTYPWSVSDPSSISKDVLGDVVEDIQEELSGLPKSQVFKVNSSAHVVVLICELVRVFVALKEGELLDGLATLGISLSKEYLKRKLFLLEKFDLISRQEYGGSIFYLAKRDDYHKLRFSLKSKDVFDPLRARMDCIEYYRVETKERTRNRVISSTVPGAKK
ncbi:TPA: retron St85 family effector protein [Pseudomonas aeruginosa]|nr:retron St85 family effector protein [Pseudomonas aeruginosa]